MKKNSLSFLLFIMVLSVQAERIITKEKFTIVISSDTVYPGEYYTLYVDLAMAENAEVKKNGMELLIDDNRKAHVRFLVVSVDFDINDNSTQEIILSINADNIITVEKIPYVV